MKSHTEYLVFETKKRREMVPSGVSQKRPLRVTSKPATLRG
jgi:hypothetical protein